MRPSGATLCHNRGEGAPSGAVVSHAIVELSLNAELKSWHMGAQAVVVSNSVEQAKLQRFWKEKKEAIKMYDYANFLSSSNTF